MAFFQTTEFEKYEYLRFPDVAIRLLGPAPVTNFSEEDMVIVKLADGRLTLVLEIWFETYLIWDPLTNSTETFKPSEELHFMVHTSGYDSTRCSTSTPVQT